MKFCILTLFPQMIEQAAGESVLGRAIRQGLIDLQTVDIRDYTNDRHKRVDDYTYGGGAGMLMQAQPVYDAWLAATKNCDKKPRTIYVTPQGRTFDQKLAKELSEEKELIFLCGHYEGIDERVLEEIVTDRISIGDYVLTGGELPALVMMDAVSRLVPGVLHNEESAQTESFDNDLLEYPQYTRPECWHDKQVPSVLLTGDHRKISAWRLEQAKERTRQNRPDLYARYEYRQKVIQWLSSKKRQHIHMMELLRRELGQVLAFDPKDGAILADEKGVIFMTCTSPQAGERLLDRATHQAGERLPDRATHQAGERLPDRATHQAGERLSDRASLPAGKPLPDSSSADLKGRLFCVCQQEIIPLLRQRYQTTEVRGCCQAYYTRGVPLPVRKDLEIRRLDLSFEEEIFREYHELVTLKELREHLSDGDMYGAFVENQLAGFIGTHFEGALGMLYVFPEFRRRGIAAALEAYMINEALLRGEIPFGQIFEGNEASLQLQKKLGLNVTDMILWWVS
ncbi:MAG: tRNA (guanosine(37)-N1)-methyltransferase TrmD [Lachnospiraceae bacterium]|nr:tRNA (guanosine(37)-N1)-methyltransferase TrmD [Lachnospiraceae bacterium]